MTWLMPVDLLPIAGMLGVIIGWPRLRHPLPLTRVLFEAFLITQGGIAACSVACALFWWLEQRW